MHFLKHQRTSVASLNKTLRHSTPACCRTPDLKAVNVDHFTMKHASSSKTPKSRLLDQNKHGARFSKIMLKTQTVHPNMATPQICLPLPVQVFETVKAQAYSRHLAAARLGVPSAPPNPYTLRSPPSPSDGCDHVCTLLLNHSIDAQSKLILHSC